MASNCEGKTNTDSTKTENSTATTTTTTTNKLNHLASSLTTITTVTKTYVNTALLPRPDNLNEMVTVVQTIVNDEMDEDTDLIANTTAKKANVVCTKEDPASYIHSLEKVPTSQAITTSTTTSSSSISNTEKDGEDAATAATSTPSLFDISVLLSSDHIVDDADYNTDHNRVTILCLEGNIGSGKSTLVDALRENNVYAIREPVEKFQTVPGTKTKPLQMYYRDPCKIATVFQCYAQSTLTQTTFEETKFLENECRKNNTSAVIVFERMVENNMETFGKITRKYMSEDQYNMLNCVSKALMVMSPKPDAVIYLDIDPEECSRRIKKRNRSCETDIPVDYLREFKKLADSYIESKERQGFPVLRLTKKMSIAQMVVAVKTFGETVKAAK